MEEVLIRFPQIGEKIFNFLDEKSLQNCKRVTKTWKNFIEDPSQKLLCIRFIKNYEKNIHIRKYISVQKDWNGLKSQDLGDFANKLSLEKGTFMMELMFLEKYETLGIKLDGYDEHGLKALHWYSNEINNKCWEDINYPKSVKNKIAEILIVKSVEYGIDINAKQIEFDCGATAFHLACLDGNIEIVQIMIEMAEAINLDLEAKCLGLTGFEYALLKGHHEIIDVIKSKIPVHK